MPVDNKILKETEIQKVKHRYQDVNKNEFCGKYRKISILKTMNKNCK